MTRFMHAPFTFSLIHRAPVWLVDDVSLFGGDIIGHERLDRTVLDHAGRVCTGHERETENLQ